MSYTEAQKKATMKWREKNKQKYRDYIHSYIITSGYYEINKPKFARSQDKVQAFRRESKRLRNILL